MFAVNDVTGSTDVFGIGLDGTLYVDFLRQAADWRGWTAGSDGAGFDGAPKLRGITGFSNFGSTARATQMFGIGLDGLVYRDYLDGKWHGWTPDFLPDPPPATWSAFGLADRNQVSELFLISG